MLPLQQNFLRRFNKSIGVESPCSRSSSVYINFKKRRTIRNWIKTWEIINTMEDVFLEMKSNLHIWPVLRTQQSKHSTIFSSTLSLTVFPLRNCFKIGYLVFLKFLCTHTHTFALLASLTFTNLRNTLPSRREVLSIFLEIESNGITRQWCTHWNVRAVERKVSRLLG